MTNDLYWKPQCHLRHTFSTWCLFYKHLSALSRPLVSKPGNQNIGTVVLYRQSVQAVIIISNYVRELTRDVILLSCMCSSNNSCVSQKISIRRKILACSTLQFHLCVSEGYDCAHANISGVELYVRIWNLAQFEFNVFFSYASARLVGFLVELIASPLYLRSPVVCEGAPCFVFCDNLKDCRHKPIFPSRWV